MSRLRLKMAERVGFEPTIRGYRIPEFQSGAFDHSATSPEAPAAYRRACRRSIDRAAEVVRRHFQARSAVGIALGARLRYLE
jgi:hypothetical protein